MARFRRFYFAVPAAFYVSAAAGQPPAAPREAAGGSPAGPIENITVLGLRTERADAGSRLGLSPFEMPASVAIIPRDLITVRGDHSTAEAVARAPGFAPVGMTAFAGSALAARGFSGNNSVAQLYDGNRLFVSGGAMSFPVDTWPFERIDILAGPASVLYGAGAIGGAVNYVPREIRRDEHDHEAHFGVGSWNTARLGLASTGPLGEAVAYRANAVLNSTDGYVDRNDNERWAVSGALLFDVGPDLALTLMFDGANIDDQGYFGTPLINGEIDPRTRRLNYNVSDANTQFRNNWTRARLDWQLSESVSLRNETYYLDTGRDFRNLENYTYQPATGLIDRSFNFGTDIDQTQWGNRLDTTLDLSLGGRADTLVLGFEVNGIDYSTASFDSGGTSVDPYQFDPGLFNEGSGFTPRLGTDTTQAAIFAENVLSIGERWKWIAGLRVETIELERHDLVTGVRVDLDFDPVTWRTGAVFAVTPSASLYGQYTVGNDAAGSLISLPATNAAELQTGEQLEVGFKQIFWDGRAGWTVAVYDITKNNLVSRDPLVPLVAQQIGEQSSRGVELALSLSPAAGFTLDANVAALEARFDDFNELIGGNLIPRSGNVPPNTPERLASLYATYVIGSDWQIGGGIRYTGRRFSDNANTLEIPSYTVADAFVSYSWNERSSVTLRGRNITDELWVVAPYNAGRQWSLGDPRYHELSMRFDF